MAWFTLVVTIGENLKPHEIDKIKQTLWSLSEKSSLDRSEIQELAKLMRRLLNSYQGAIKKLYKQRIKLRKDNHENNGH